MIVVPIPTTRGEMTFSSYSSRSASESLLFTTSPTQVLTGSSRGETFSDASYFEDITKTVLSGSTSSSYTTAQEFRIGTETSRTGTSESGETTYSTEIFKTLASYTTTETTNVEAVNTTRTYENGYTTFWTTTSNSENTSTFFTTTDTVTTTIGLGSSFTKETTGRSVVEDGTIVANIYDYLYIAEPEKNELIVGLIETSSPPNWLNEAIFADTAILSIGESVLLTNSVYNKTIETRAINESTNAPNFVASGETKSVDYDEINRPFIFTTSADSNQVPPKQNSEISFQFEIIPSQFTFVEENVINIGATDFETELTSTFIRPRTEGALLLNGQTYRKLDFGNFSGAPIYATATFKAAVNPYPIFVDSGSSDNTSFVDIGGDTTFSFDPQYFGLNSLGLFYTKIKNENEDITYNGMGKCSIVKPLGVFDGDGFASFFSINDTTISGNIIAQLSRAVDVNIDSVQDVGYGDLNLGYPRNKEINYGIATLLTTFGNTWTLSGKSLTYRTNQTQQTQSTLIEMVGSPQTQVVNIKTILGGTPEQYATFYCYAPRGIYFSDTDMNTVFINGEITTINHGESVPTYFLQPAMFLYRGGARVQTVDKFGFLRIGEDRITAASP